MKNQSFGKAVILLSFMLMAAASQAQTKVKQVGNMLVTVVLDTATTATSMIANSTATDLNFHTKDGESLPVWKNDISGKLYVIRQSKKTGNVYRQYLEIEN